MAKRGAMFAPVLGLALLGIETHTEAGPISRRFQQWAATQPQVSSPAPNTVKTIDLNLTRAAWPERVRQWPATLAAKTRAGTAMWRYRSKLPKGTGPSQLWRQAPTMGEFKMTTQTMKHRSDGTLVH